MLKHSNIIVNLEREIIGLQTKLEKSEKIRQDLVEINRILTIAVQQAIDDLRFVERPGRGACAFNTLNEAEAEVRKISVKEY